MGHALTDFLADSLLRPWSWEKDNCGLWVADWVLLKTGIDPAAEFRLGYSSPDDWRELIRREGGFMPLIGYAMDTCGFERTQSPAEGDVGVISALVQSVGFQHEVAAIRHDGCWVSRGRTRLHWGPWPMLASWKTA